MNVIKQKRNNTKKRKGRKPPVLLARRASGQPSQATLAIPPLSLFTRPGRYRGGLPPTTSPASTLGGDKAPPRASSVSPVPTSPLNPTHLAPLAQIHLSPSADLEEGLARPSPTASLPRGHRRLRAPLTGPGDPASTTTSPSHTRPRRNHYITTTPSSSSSNVVDLANDSDCGKPSPSSLSHDYRAP